MNIDRYYSERLKPYGKLSKPVKILNPNHLAFIRNQPCLITGMPMGNDAHHLQKKSQIRNDFTAVPLRHDVHMEFHSIEWTNFEAKYAIDLKDALIAQLIERIMVLENKA